MIIDVLRSTVEWKNWGFNALTISFIATLGFGLAQVWSLEKQKRTIRDNGSSGDLDPLLYSYIVGVMFSFIVYGLGERSVAMVVNGLLGIPYFLLVWEIFMFSARSKRGHVGEFKRLLYYFVILTQPIVMIAMSEEWRQTYLFAIMGISVAPQLKQTVLLWWNRTATSVDIRFVIVFALSCLFWTIYGGATDQWAIYSINGATFGITAFMALAWFKFERPRLEWIRLGKEARAKK